MKEHKDEIDRWVALDDDTLCESLGDNWLQCCWPPEETLSWEVRCIPEVVLADRGYGLTPELADQAIEYLNQSELSPPWEQGEK